MLQLSEPTDYPIPLFRLAFRPLFLFGMLFSFLAMGVWILQVNAIISIEPYGGSTFWHAHEMLFGFVCAIIVGFLLTAVQNWTGIPGLSGKPLMLLFALWLIPRITGLIENFPETLHCALDLLFLPAAAFFMARSVLAVRQYRNLFFIPILLLLDVANGLMHSSVLTDNSEFYQQGYSLAIWLICIIITVLGGRVIPFFTANGTRTDKTPPIKFIEISSVAGLVLIAVIFSLGLDKHLPANLQALLFLLTGCAQLIRCARWKIWICAKVPLLWSLHAAYWFIPLGLLSIAANKFNLFHTSPSTLIHFFTAGAIGGLILAMASRVALGHTGRMLEPPRLMSLAFIAILLGGLLRTSGIISFSDSYSLLINISAIFWLLSYGLFVYYYAPMMWKPRADGKRG